MKTKPNPKPSAHPSTALLVAISLCGMSSTVVVHAAPGDTGNPAPQSSAANANRPKEGKPADKDELLAQRRAEQIEKSRKEGKISALEADFMALMTRKFDSPQARQEAISDWRSEKGAALDAEREQKRAREKPQRDAQFAKMRENRGKQISESKKSGRIGAMEAEFMTLVNRDHGSPEARRQAIRAWHEAKGAALASERAEKEAMLRPIREAQAIALRDRRSQQVSDAIASGKIGPLEGQLQTVLNSDYESPQERQLALRTWMEKNHAALENEKSARRPTISR